MHTTSPLHARQPRNQKERVVGYESPRASKKTHTATPHFSPPLFLFRCLPFPPPPPPHPQSSATPLSHPSFPYPTHSSHRISRISRPSGFICKERVFEEEEEKPFLKDLQSLKKSCLSKNKNSITREELQERSFKKGASFFQLFASEY